MALLKCRDLLPTLQDPTRGYRKGCQVFSVEQESELASYLLQAGNIYYGLSTTETRKLAYEYAEVNVATVPQPWRDMKAAGEDWLYVTPISPLENLKLLHLVEF